MSEDRFSNNIALLDRFDSPLAERIKAYLKEHPGKPSLPDNEVPPIPVTQQGSVSKMSDYGNLTASDLIILYGFGNGSHIRDIVESTPRSTFVLVIESSLAAFTEMLSQADLKPLLTCGHLHLSVEEDPARAVRYHIENHLGVMTISDFNVIKDPASVVRSPSYFERIDREVEELKKIAILNRSTIERFSLTWQRHIFINLPFIISNPGIRNLFGRFKGIPTVIVSAGPSLDSNVKWLRGVENRCLIIAVDSALRALMENGITPHCVLSLDPEPDNFLHLEGVNAGKTILIMNPVTYPAIPRDHKGPILTMTFGDPLMAWLEESIGELGETLAGGSVSTSAFDLAVRMGCSPIILAGQDLSYESKRAYTSGCFYNRWWQDDINRYTTLSSKHEHYMQIHKSEDEQNVWGHGIGTNHKMLSWKRWLETRGTGMKCVNATEGGLPIEGFTHISLQNAVMFHCAVPHPIGDLLEDILSRSKKPDASGLRERLSHYLDTLEKVKKIGEEGIEIGTGLTRLLRVQGAARDVSYYLERLNALSAEIMNAGEFMEINQWEIDSLLHKISDRQDDGKSREERWEETVDTYRLLFAEIKRISGWGIQQVREGIKGIEGLETGKRVG